MLELLNTSVFDLVGLFVGLAPIVILAALAMIDLRTVMVLRAANLLKGKVKPGETRISGDEWSPTPAAAK